MDLFSDSDLTHSYKFLFPPKLVTVVKPREKKILTNVTREDCREVRGVSLDLVKDNEEPYSYSRVGHWWPRCVDSSPALLGLASPSL